MSTTVGIQLSFFEGEVGTYLLFLFNNGSLINAGGDALVEVANGYFTAEVEEELTTTVSYEAVITKDAAKIYTGWLLLARSATIDDPGTGSVVETPDVVDPSVLSEFGPKRVKTPNIEIEQFSPREIAMGRNLAATPPVFGDSHVDVAIPYHPFVRPPYGR